MRAGTISDPNEVQEVESSIAKDPLHCGDDFVLLGCSFGLLRHVLHCWANVLDKPNPEEETGEVSLFTMLLDTIEINLV